ncbi:glycosyltransferase family 2 protein [Paenibacillus larvae]|uniref:glycosyltransferase family 2 protein n=1 Tax=Paenibacillus larvae TaxID=1464 RepID=UPI0037CB6A43
MARQNGTLVLEQHDPTKKSKGYGLEWAFEQLWNMEARGTTYDAVLVLDADNLVTPNTLKVLNQRIVSGGEVLQLYLDSKNPKDSWISNPMPMLIGQPIVYTNWPVKSWGFPLSLVVRVCVLKHPY